MRHCNGQEMEDNDGLPLTETKMLNEVVKSPSDNYEYRAFMLTNRMKVIVASDPNLKEAAVALSVKIGSFSDPTELPGLAHYLEHMLFAGSEKYPVEDNFPNYIRHHKGILENITTYGQTLYSFACSPQALEGAIDRFAQFFIHPLFLDSCLEREVDKIDLEYENKIQDDGSKWIRVSNFLTKESLPLSRFSEGNKETLWKLPMENGIDVKSELVKFYKTYYSSNLMTLAVVGKRSCNELQQMVERHFTPVQNTNVEIPMWPESPFGPGQLQTRINVLQVKDVPILCLVFPIPYSIELEGSGPWTYIISAINRKAPGTLHDLLERKKWADFVNARLFLVGRGFAFCLCEIKLTSLGADHVDDIAMHVFEYFKLLREMEPQAYYWEELKVINERRFDLLDKQSPSDLAVYLARSMSMHAVEKVWTSTYLLTDFQPEVIKAALNLLVPENVRIVFSAREINEGRVSETEQLFGAKYSYEKIPQDLVEKWKSCGLNSLLKFPPQNPFLAAKFELKPREAEAGITPRIIFDDEFSRLWFLQDNEFLQPEAVILLDIYSPCSQQSPKNHLLQQVFVTVAIRMLDQELDYMVSRSGLTYNITSSVNRIRILVEGYDDKLATLLSYILEHLVNFSPADCYFEDSKQELIHKLENWKFASSSAHAVKYAEEILSDFAFKNEDLLAAVCELTPADLLSYTRDMLSSVKLEWLIYGNVTEKEALEIHSKEMEHFHRVGSKPLLEGQLVPCQDILLPKGSNVLYRPNHPAHKVSCVHVVLQCDDEGLRASLILRLICHIMDASCLELNIHQRMEKLGVTCDSLNESTRRVLRLQIYLRGAKHPEYLESRIEYFLELMASTIEELTPESLEKCRRYFQFILSPRHKNLVNRIELIAAEISSQRYCFDIPNLLLEELRKITLEDLKSFYNKWIKPGSPDRRKLSVHVISDAEGGAGHPQSPSEQESVELETRKVDNQEVIEDEIWWKSQQNLFPLPKPHGNVPPWKFSEQSCVCNYF